MRERTLEYLTVKCDECNGEGKALYPFYRDKIIPELFYQIYLNNFLEYLIKENIFLGTSRYDYIFNDFKKTLRYDKSTCLKCNGRKTINTI